MDTFNATKGATILIVDDSRFQRTIIRELLREHFNIFEAESGEECLGIIKKDKVSIDLLILDLEMPGIDGFDVLRRRQEIQHFADIPVIVLTATNSSDVQASVYELGANDFLIKPIDPKTAFFRIQNLLKSKHRIASLIKEYDDFKFKSKIDEMTGLLNKSATIKLITDALKEYPNGLHALMAVDIDNFKAINDVYGHTVGDHTISIVASVMASQFEKTDIAGRIGGDEFVLFVRDIESRKYVYEKAQNIVDIISAKENMSIPEDVTISIGVVFTDGTEKDYTELFAKADEALYESKHAGKSCYREYGVKLDGRKASKTIPVITRSRNVISIIEFVHEASYDIRKIDNINDFEKLISGVKNIPCIYVDISEMEDNGYRVLEDITNTDNLIIKNMPIAIICKEGSMEQIRLAAGYDCVKDILFAPIEPQQLKRRIAAYRSKISD